MNATPWIVGIAVALAACAEGHGPGASSADAGASTPATPSRRDPTRHAAILPVPATFAKTALRSIPTGSFTPLFRGKGGDNTMTVAGFCIEEHPVTNAQFAAFLCANPKWRRSQAPLVLAQEDYLKDWRDDLTPPTGVDEVAHDNRPVSAVSWFAARAYAKWIGRRLPTVAEWEMVGAASDTLADASDDPVHTARILEWYSRPARDGLSPVRSTIANVHGVWDMHGLVWEWTEDFNSALVTGESRGDASLERNLFCGAGATGAADPSDYAAFMRTAFRSSMRGAFAVRNVGFRCATDSATPSGSHADPTAK